MNRVRFRKSFLPGWTDEIFQVAQVFRGKTSYCKIKNLNHNILTGTFCEELQKVYKDNDAFRFDSIIKKRRSKKGVQYLVKWFGYSPSFNSWVEEKDFQNA